MSDNDSHNVGLIGAGLLGSALAHRLIAGGFRVVGFDVDPSAMDRLRLLGAARATAPEEVVRNCRRVMLSLPGPAQMLEVVHAIEPWLSAGDCVLDTTTGDPEVVESVAARLADKRIAWLDAEVGGSSRQTANGEAIILCGGTSEAVNRCGDILHAIGSRVFHTGPPGTGTRMKLALNIAIGLHRAVLAESLEFARANGIAPELALEILRSGPAWSKAMDIKGDKMLSGDFTPEARLAQHLKDVTLIRKTGTAVGARLPLSAIHEQLLREAVDLGLGAQDNSAIIRVFSARSSPREGVVITPRRGES